MESLERERSPWPEYLNPDENTAAEAQNPEFRTVFKRNLASVMRSRYPRSDFTVNDFEAAAKYKFLQMETSPLVVRSNASGGVAMQMVANEAWIRTREEMSAAKKEEGQDKA